MQKGALTQTLYRNFRGMGGGDGAKAYEIFVLGYLSVGYRYLSTFLFHKLSILPTIACFFVFVCLEFQIIRFVISTFSIEISFVLQKRLAKAFFLFCCYPRVWSDNWVDLSFFVSYIVQFHPPSLQPPGKRHCGTANSSPAMTQNDESVSGMLPRVLLGKPSILAFFLLTNIPCSYLERRRNRSSHSEPHWGWWV